MLKLPPYGSIRLQTASRRRSQQRISYETRTAVFENDQYLFYTLIKGLKGRMSEDNVSYFLKRYAGSAHQVCSEVPLRMHAHLFRHTRAMHLYQTGIPLSYIKDFLGYVSINTTDIYASTDTSMMRAALEKIDKRDGKRASTVEPKWQDNEEMILKLCGLK